MIPVPAPSGAGTFVHTALFHQDLDGYLAGVGGFVRSALAAGEPVLVSVPGTRLDLLRESLGERGSEITWTDMTELGRNPGRVLGALHDFAERHAGRPARMVAEPVWPGRSPAELREAARHEALVNAAFAGRTGGVLCPYDVRGLAPAVLAGARRTHPARIEDGRRLAGPARAEAALISAEWDLPLPEFDGEVFRLDYARGGLSEVREHAEGWARTTALSRARRGDLILAVSEAAANSLAHGGGKGTLRLWVAPGPAGAGSEVVAEIHDAGRLTDPLAGRRRPSAASANGGRGLWMIHQLCDLVEVRTTDSGFTLRLHMATP